MRFLALFLTLLAALCAVAPAAAGQARHLVSDRFTTDRPGAPAGRSFSVDYRDPAAPDAKPPAAERIRLTLAPGARFDTSAVERCEAGDAALIAQGAAACPAGSRVGSSVLVFDTGAEPNRLVTSDLAFFNARDALIILATGRNGGARVVTRGRIGRDTLEIDVPPLPGMPPEGGALTEERASFDARGGYLTTPPDCPPSGEWQNSLSVTYRDGVTQTVRSGSPCSTPAPAPAPSAAERTPCRSRRAFDIRLDPRLRRAQVRVGGRPAKVRRGAGGRLTARVDLRGRPAGRVAVTIRGVARDGARLRSRRTYRTCAGGR